MIQGKQKNLVYILQWSVILLDGFPLKKSTFELIYHYKHSKAFASNHTYCRIAASIFVDKLFKLTSYTDTAISTQIIYKYVILIPMLCFNVKQFDIYYTRIWSIQTDIHTHTHIYRYIYTYM